MLPQDPMILLSWLNTKLRDEYDSLEALWEDTQADREAATAALAALGYAYDPAVNQFRPQV